MTHGVLGLDLAAKYGWAYVSDDGRYVASGHRELRAADHGARAHQLQLSISDLVTEFAPDFIAVEKPNSHHYGAARSLFGYATIAHWVAHVRELGYAELVRGECYKSVVGKGNAKKIAAVEWARQFKPLLNSDDEADAVLVAFAAHKMRDGAS